MLCKSSEKLQQSLLESGDGSQVMRDHSIAIDEDENERETGGIALDTVPAGSSRNNNTVNDRKRKFPSFRQFTAAGGEEMKRKISPIERWVTLTVKELYLVKKVIEIEVVIKKKKQPGFYVELESRDGDLKNVWISEMIREGLDKFAIEEGDTYIMPLGLRESKENPGQTYHNFAIQSVKDN